MRIRFLQVTPSGVPEFPFLPGQIIEVPASEEWLALLDGVRAEAIKDVEVERAVAPVVSPVPSRRKARKRS